jgi:dynein heavy chain
VPEAWARLAYPSLKPLSSWTKDLLARTAAMEVWLTGGQPRCFWLPGLFFPQGFTTAVLQNHARMARVPIDRLSLSFTVLPGSTGPEDIKESPAEGVLVHGLFLEGGRWDDGAGCLAAPAPGELYCRLPVVHFVPREEYCPPEGQYSCPLYKTAARAGVLSTTGHSTNFVLHMSLPVAQGSRPEEYVLRGTAALCSLSS